MEGEKLHLAFLEGGVSTSPLFSPEAVLPQWEARLKREVEVLEDLLQALGELHPETGDPEDHPT
jgi:hypothetical protein